MKRVTIVGGGASGVFCACLLKSGAPDLYEVQIVEQGNQLLRKVRASGNGRCNFTNEHLSTSHYLSKEGEEAFVREALRALPSSKVRSIFQSLGLLSVSLESGMVYPRTLRSESLVRCLTAWLDRLRIPVIYGKEVVQVERKGETFLLSLASTDADVPLSPDKEKVGTDLLILATGGAYGIGKDERSCGYSLVRPLGHRLTPIHAGICALTVEEKSLTKACQGWKVQAGLEDSQGNEVQGDLLFTDYGLSGIGIFRLSNLLLDRIQKSHRPQALTVNLFPEYGSEEFMAWLRQLSQDQAGTPMKDIFAAFLPPALLSNIGASLGRDLGEPLGNLGEEDLETLLFTLQRMSFTVTGSRRRDHGQVTCGGIATEDISPKTMESLWVPGLYFLGEIMDIQGECGGYNLHWAWASAYLCAEHLLHAGNQS